MKTTAYKPKTSAVQPNRSTARPVATNPVNTTNSMILSAKGSWGGGMENLEQQMFARMRSYRNAQIPGAEREADAIASTVRPTASEEEVKSTLGQKLGADFSKVRIHSDARAGDMADSIGAEAYTKGNDVYLGSGVSDAQTVAHELVHTVQQGGVEGFGVTQSAAFGSVQMKPGKRARLKNWFKRKFHLSSTKSNDNGERVTDNGAGKIIEPEATISDRAFTHGLGRDKMESFLEDYHHTDKTAKVRQMEAGDFDAHFDALETDEERVNELQRLAQYLSVVRQENELDKKEMSDYDLALAKTYKSSLQKASGSDSFMRELMKQTTGAAEALSNAQWEERERNPITAYEKKMSTTDWNVVPVREGDTANDELRAKERKDADVAYQSNLRNKVYDADVGRRFNVLRFMMGDATNLMIDGDQRLKWNEKRRMHFSDESKGYEGLHEGQMKDMLEDGTIDYTDVSRYASKVYSANRDYAALNHFNGVTDKTEEKKRRRNQKYIKNYKLPGQK